MGLCFKKISRFSKLSNKVQNVKKKKAAISKIALTLMTQKRTLFLSKRVMNMQAKTYEILDQNVNKL